MPVRGPTARSTTMPAIQPQTRRELAKFFCGFEAFHALAHAALAFSGTTITVLGIDLRPGWHWGSILINGSISVALGLYAWRRPR